MKKLSSLSYVPYSWSSSSAGWGLRSPPQAQQTVTLSGRVTAAAGNAVSGAFVELFRMPGWVWVDGQDTDGTGAYSLSMSPGTYRPSGADSRWAAHCPKARRTDALDEYHPAILS